MTSTYEIRSTSTNGFAHTIPATKATADRLAAEESRYSSCIEADILRNGEFVAAYINGARVLW